jgi:hypothetical protein
MYALIIESLDGRDCGFLKATTFEPTAKPKYLICMISIRAAPIAPALGAAAPT